MIQNEIQIQSWNKLYNDKSLKRLAVIYMKSNKANLKLTLW